MSHYHNTITSYGDQISLNLKIQDVNNFVKWTEENFEYVKYNPRKKINRYGLSITSLDGALSGTPDLDSLYEFNHQNNTNYSEKDFTTLTPVAEYPSLQQVIDPFKGNIFRTHILKLGSGGFFPPHRDFRESEINSCRLIIPLTNINPPRCNFIIEDKILNWESGRLYYVNTAKMHYLFNCSAEDSYWIVINLELNEYTTAYILNNTEFQ